MKLAHLSRALLVGGVLALTAAAPAPALAAGGTLLALGDNGHDELGYEGPAHSPTATPVAIEGEIASAAQGEGFSLAASTSGKLYGFGNGEAGELGEPCGPKEDQEEAPHTIEIGTGEHVKQVAAGANFSLVVTTAGKLYSFGANEQGQLGRGMGLTKQQECTPSEVSFGTPVTVTQAAAGKEFALVVTSTGTVYGFGSNTRDQLAQEASKVPHESKPVEIAVEGTETASEVAAGEASSYVLTAKHEVFAFGNNASGELGRSEKEVGGFEPMPTQPSIEFAKGELVTQIAAGGDFALALTSTGRVFSFGGDESGELGRVVPTEEGEPLGEVGGPVVFPKAAQPITDIAAGSGFAVAVDSAGNVWAWGEDEYEQLGYQETPGEEREVKEIALPQGDLAGAAGGGPMGTQTLLVTSATAKKLAEPLAIEPPGGAFASAGVGSHFSAELYATGGVKPYTWSAQGLPRGLSIASSTGVISGTPQSAGVYSIQATVTDAEGRHASRAVRLDVEREKPPAFAELKESARAWRESSRLPRIAGAKPPVGTEFFFGLSAPGHVTLTFCRVRGRHCKAAGTLSFERRRGFASIHFYGRLTARRRLSRGHYKVSFKASNAAGSRSGGSLSFEIVR